MKKTILAAALTLTAASAFAQYNGRCEIGLTNRNGQVLQTFRSVNSDCYEALKECRKEIRMNSRYQVGINDCVELNNRPGPQNPGPQNPGPQNPGPQYPGPQNPYPGQTGYDARRMINQGESVVFNNRIVTVAGISFNGTFAVRANDVWNTITNNVRREALSVMNGCSQRLCTSDSVIDISTRTYVKLIALSYDDRFVTQANDVWNTITSNIDRSRLAETKGCISSRYAQICVGNQVITQQNVYATIAGIQQDGRVVLRQNDVWNTITPNVNPENLVITR